MSQRPTSTPDEHKATAPRPSAASSSRCPTRRRRRPTRAAGLIRELLTGGGHTVVGSAIVRDEPTDVQRVVREACADPRVQVVILTGGTGITSRDSTYEAVEALLDKRLPGFGELFRDALLPGGRRGRHAVAGADGHPRPRIVVSLPGSPNACRLALEKLLLPELGHLVREVSR